jgi:phosphatidylserine decarboxylase
MTTSAPAKYPHPCIAREGWPFIFIALLAALTATWLDWTWLSAPMGIVFLFVLQFFRDPPRFIVGDTPFAVASPADGRIVAIEECDDVWRSRSALKISVFMNVFNVHANRSPIDGEVTHVSYHPGKFLNAALAKASTENERCATVIRGVDGQEITCVQVAGLVARRVLNYTEPGKTLARGDRFGFIRFGSRVDVYLPLDARVHVSIGDKVYAAETLLADLAKAPAHV